jgi:hypothetical protein
VNAEGKTDDVAKKLHALAVDAVKREIKNIYK